MRKAFLIIALCGCLIAVAAILWRSPMVGQRPIHVALVAAMTSERTIAGTELENYVQLYFSKVNRRGGINGHKLILDVYDDQLDPTTARQQAQQVIEDGRAVAVIGHVTDATCLAAGEIYRQHGIAVITPMATGVNITHANPWYFRSIYNENKTIDFAVQYARHVLDKQKLAIVMDIGLIDERKIEHFTSYAQQSSLEIVSQLTLDSASSEEVLQARLDEIPNQLAAAPADGILLATDVPEGITLVRRIRDVGVDVPIIGVDLFATTEFQRGFAETPRRKPPEGSYTSKFYTDDLYVVAAGTNEAGQQEMFEVQAAYVDRYNAVPDYLGAYAYDAAKAIVHAIEQTSAGEEPDRLAADRERIRDYLAAWTDPRNAIPGATGPIFFDDYGDMPRSPLMLQYESNQPVAALTQLIPVNLQSLDDPGEAFREGRLLYLSGQYMVKVNVVFTGIDMWRVKEVNEDEHTFDAEFDLWFRYRGQLEGDKRAENVRFLNSVVEIALEESSNAAASVDVAPSASTASMRLVEHEEIPQQIGESIHYKLYRVRGRFKADYEARKYAYRQHALGIHFRHRTMNMQSFLYAPDLLGMVSERKLGVTTTFGRHALTRELNEAKVISPALGWTITDVNVMCDTFTRDARGNPRYLSADSSNVEYSRFNYEIFVAPAGLRPTKWIAPHWGYWMLGTSGLLAVVSWRLSRRLSSRRTQSFFKSAAVVLLVTGVLSLQVVIFTALASGLSNQSLFTIENAFEVVWWILGAVAIDVLIEKMIWVPLEARTGQRVPQAIRVFFRAIIYTSAVLGIIAFVFDLDITSVLATSGVITVIVGLAIQASISNAFAGLVLNLERPFRIGDWVKIGDYDEGQVVEFTWRSTRLKTWDGNFISIPNSIAIEAASTNYGSHRDNYTESITVNVDARYPPEKVKSVILAALDSTEGIALGDDTLTGCRFTGITDWSATYSVIYTFRDYQGKRAHREAVWQRVWEHLNRAGITPATRRQEIRMLRGHEEEVVSATQPFTIFSRLNLFAPLTEREIVMLSEKVKRQSLEMGATAVSQGQSVDTIYWILNGVARCEAHRDDGTIATASDLAPGDTFCELAALTGRPQGCTVTATNQLEVLTLHVDDLAAIVQPRPKVASELGARLQQELAGRPCDACAMDLDQIISEVNHRLLQSNST